MRRTTRNLILILSIASLCFLLNLGGPHLWDRDEPRNAGCAAEMLAAGDWVVPTFNAELREHKPVLTYWLMMLSYLVFGVNEFAARFPSALLGIGTTVLTYVIGRRLVRESTGLWAAIAIATTMMFGVASRAATPDAPLIFFSTLAITLYVVGVTQVDSSGESRMVRLFPESWGLCILMYSAMGMAVLAKGPIGLVIPTAVIGMFLLIKRLPESRPVESRHPLLNRSLRIVRPFAPLHFLKTCWTMRPFTAIACALTIALPWYILVHQQTNGEWTYGFFMKHNVGRAMNAMDGHRGFILFYPAALIMGFFPWSIFWLPALFDGARQLKTGNRWNNGYLFAFCWVGVYLGLFSLAKTKLPSYVTPCYPGLALAIGAFVDRWARGEIELPAVWRRVAFGSLIAFGVGVMIAIPILAAIYVPSETIISALGLVPLTGGIIAWNYAKRDLSRQAVYATAATAVIMSPLIFAFAADRIDSHRQVERMVDLLYHGKSADQVDVISFANVESSWIYYAGQPIEPHRDPEETARLLAESNSAGQPRVLITTGVQLKKLEPYLDDQNVIIEQMPYFMKKTDIVVIHPRQSVIQTAAEERTPPRH